MNQPARIAFIGLGIMGRPMVAHLLAAGQPVSVYSRTRSKAEPCLAAGATWADSPNAAARACDVLMLNVTDGPDVEQVLFGPGGAADGLARGTLVIDFSTIAPETARSVAERLAARGVAFLDAPVTGGQIGAQNATLTIMVGGPAEAFERARPLMAKLGRKIVHVGPSGAGQALKACNQIMCAVNMLGVCEAVKLARASGLDLAQAIETLSDGAGGSWAWKVLGGKLAAGDLQPAFMIKLMQKDLRIVQAAARRLFGADFPATALAASMLQRAAERPGGAELGTQAMWLAYEGRAGIEGLRDSGSPVHS